MPAGTWSRRAVLVATILAAAESRGGEIVLSNAALEIRIDDATGAVRQVRNLAKGLDLVAVPGAAPPFVLSTTAGNAAAGPVQAHPDPGFPGAAVDLAWSTDKAGISVAARIELPDGATDARFTFRVENLSATIALEHLEYPVLDGIRRLQPSGGSDVALSAAAQGYLFRDPWANLVPGVVKRLYPDGYDGVSLQTSAYYREGTGGFALEARDAQGTAKRFGFYRDPGDGDLRWSVETLAWDRRAGTGMDPGFEIRLAALVQGDWEEAADRYRTWALDQPWASRGRVEDRPDAEVPRWLYTSVRAATFGVSINLDQSRWFAALHDWVGGPLLHVSGFWWPGGTAASEWYGGYNDWGDGRVNVANLATIRGRGDFWAPFLFDQHFSRDATEWDAPSPNPATDPVAPWQPYEMVPDPESAPWAYMCPATAAWQAFHGWRDVEILGNWDHDATYYDIGPGLGRVRCHVEAHGHAPGSGRALVEGTRAMLASRRSDLHQAAGRRVAAGTELVSELYLRELDFYQARAEASVMSMLEGDAFRAGEKAGWAVKVPLFAYVYHDVGPVRLDGNLKAASQFGEIFWWIAARTVAWGGIPELNYELSALEKFPGMNDPFTWYETYKPTYHVMDRSPYLAVAARGSYLGRLGAARTGFARPFLAYGRMARPARLTSSPAPITVDWNLYNTFHRAADTSSGIESGAEYYERGSIAIDPTVHAAWVDGAGRLGLFFVDVAATSSAVTVEIDPDRHGLAFLNYALSRVEGSGTTDLGVRSGVQTLTLTLPSREPVLLVAEPAPCAAPTCLYRVYRGTSAPDLPGSPPFATATGHAWDDPAPADGVDRFYLVDDGAGFPTTTLRVDRSEGVVRLTW